jgi:ATP-dependent DNA helicase PIF1
LRGMSAREVQGPAETPWIAAARQSVADQLCAAASRATLTGAVVERLREAEVFLGAEILSGACVLEQHDIGAALVPGARICFTGTAQDATGRIVERDEMERLAQKAGLAPVKSVTKTRCEVLVTAEAGSQSGKARKAQEYGKPVFSADEFFAWLAGKGIVDAAASRT